MRAVSIIVLAAVVLGAGYVFVFQRDWLFDVVDKGQQIVEGYEPADTPKKALDSFRKAIKERDYKWAGKLYATGDYAEALQDTHDQARAIGQHIDTIVAYAEENSLDKDHETRSILFALDPFPSNFDVKGKPEKGKDDKLLGVYKYDLGKLNPQHMFKVQNRLDPQMFKNFLMFPPNNQIGKDEFAVEVGEGDDKSWKVKVEWPQFKAEDQQYFKDNYKRYENALADFVENMPKERFTNSDKFRDALVDKLSDAKE